MAAALVAVMLPFAALAWRRKYWSVVGRVYYTVLVACGVIVIALLGYHHLLGYWY